MQKLYTELSAYALELYMGQFSTPSTVVDSEGNESYTEDAQDKFNEIAADIEAILKKNGVSKYHLELMDENVKPLELEEINLFDSKKSVQEVQEYMSAYAGKEHAYIAQLAIGLTYNALIRMIDEQGGGHAISIRSKKSEVA